MRCATRFIGVLGLALAGQLAGCASAPIQEMSDARQAIQAAEQVRADALTPKDLELARHHVLRAEQALEVRAYHRARKEAQEAQTLATRARAVAVALTETRQSVEEAKRLGIAPADAIFFLDGAMQAARRGEDQRAQSLAGRARELSAAAVDAWYNARARRLLDRFEISEARMGPGERAQLEKARSAYRRGDGRAAYEILTRLHDGR
jgi:hypothetical protein